MFGRKVILVFLSLFLISAMVFAGGEKQSGSSASASGKKTVTFWFYMENRLQQEALRGVIDGFNKSQNGIEVVSRYVPFADFKKQLSIGVAASELPDIVIIDGPDHASYAAMGIFADVTGKIDVSQFYDGPMASCTLNNKIYGVPFGSNCLALYYNKDMLDAAGVKVPATWDELRDAARRLTTNRVKGIAFCSLQNEEGTFNFMPWLWSTGTSSFQINNPQGIKALTYVSDLVKDGSMPREAINWTQGDVNNQFMAGNLAMMINGPWQIPTIRKDAANLNWGVTLIPRDSKYASVLGGENWAIINNNNVAASLEFIKYMTSPAVIRTYINEFGYIAARKDVASNQFTGDTIMEKFAEQLQYASPRGPHARWPEISDAISLAFNEVITQASTAAQAAAKAQGTIDRIVR
jgi:multiple sugar transport system substrate-binding protein